MPDHSICLIWYQVFTKPCMSRFRFEIELMSRTIGMFDKWYALKSSKWGSWEDWWRHWVPTFSRVASYPHGRNSPTWLAAPLWEVHLHSSPQQPKLCSFTSELGKVLLHCWICFRFQKSKGEKLRKVCSGHSCWWSVGDGLAPGADHHHQLARVAPHYSHYCTIALVLTLHHWSVHRLVHQW